MASVVAVVGAIIKFNSNSMDNSSFSSFRSRFWLLLCLWRKALIMIQVPTRQLILSVLLGIQKLRCCRFPIIYGGPIRVAGNVFYEKYIDAEKRKIQCTVILEYQKDQFIPLHKCLQMNLIWRVEN